MEAALNGPLGRTALGQGTLKIGRAPDNTLVINDPQSSSHHAEVGPDFAGNGYQVIDLNSTNGTFVNEQRLTAHMPHTLNNGDVIRIGALRLTYEAGAPAAGAAFNDAQTVADARAGAQPTVYQQAPAFNNYSAPAQPPAFTPPPPQATQPRMEYPQAGGFNQPGYQPGGFNQPAPQAKKSRVGLWIGLILVVIVLIAGGTGAFVYFQNRSTPEKTLQAFCTALQSSDAQGYYNTLSSQSQAQTDLQQISTGFQLLKLLTGGFTSCTYSNVVVNGSTATAQLVVTSTRGKTISEPVSLVDENGQWKMSSGKNLPGISR
jgi:hypothetical protein